MLKVFLFCLLSPMISFTQETIDSTGRRAIDTTGSKISPEDARAVLDHHNKARNDLGIPPLTWSAELAAYAQVWADSLANTNDCNLKHRDNREKGYGENIFAGSSGFKPLDASIGWYNEIKNYTYGKIDESNSNAWHYTQMIWKNTKETGLGMATCPNGNVVVVANYSPAGNFSGEIPY